MKHSITLSIGLATFRIGSAWAKPIDQLRSLYSAYPHEGEDVIADFTVRLDSAGPLRTYWRPSVQIAGDHMLADAAPMALRHGLLAAEMGMNLQMALGWRRHVLIHASAAEKEGRVLVMSGESGSGKSTLAAMLGESGWRFMGDEFALLDLETGHVFPFPRLISLKNHAIDVMRDWVGDDSRLGPVMRATPKGDIRHMVPPENAIACMKKGAAPALLLFPSYGYSPKIRGIGKGEAFMRLTQASTNYVACGEGGFNALCRFVEQTPVVALDYESGEQAINTIDQLWSELV
jgi:HprK-related kinase A